MHEVGIGMTSDLHLAKRYYDMSYQTSSEARIPATIALKILDMRFFLQWLSEEGEQRDAFPSPSFTFPLALARVFQPKLIEVLFSQKDLKKKLCLKLRR